MAANGIGQGGYSNHFTALGYHMVTQRGKRLCSSIQIILPYSAICYTYFQTTTSKLVVRKAAYGMKNTDKRKNDFLIQIKTGKPFLWEHDKSHTRIFSIPDDLIKGVRHVYLAILATPDSHSSKFNHAGFLIGSTIYNACYNLTNITKHLGLSYALLNEVQAELSVKVTEQVSAALYTLASKLAPKAINSARMDIARMQGEAQCDECLRSHNFHKYKPLASASIIQNLLSEPDSSHDAYGKAYKAFYNYGLADIAKTILVNIEVTEREALAYLAARSQDKAYEKLIKGKIKTHKSDIVKENNKIVDTMAERIIVEEFYNKLVAETDGSHYLIRDIYNKVRGDELADAKTVNVIVEVEGERFSFKLPRTSFNRERIIHTYDIDPRTTRKDVNSRLRARGEHMEWPYDYLLVDDIVEVTYKKKIVYKKGGEALES